MGRKSVIMTVAILIALNMAACNTSKAEATDMPKNNQESEATNTDNQKEKLQPENNKVEDNIETDQDSAPEQEKETVSEFIIRSSEGVDIISFDETQGYLRFKAVCAYCGNVDSMTDEKYLSGTGSYDSSYTCNKCGELTDIVIEYEENVTFQ